MSLDGKRVAVLAEDYYQELELWYPVLRLREAGAEVVVVGTGSAQTYTGKYGYPVTVDTEAGEVQASDFDALVIPGGYAPDRMRRYAAVNALARQMFLVARSWPLSVMGRGCSSRPMFSAAARRPASAASKTM